MADELTSSHPHHKLVVLRCAATGGTVLGSIYAMCWIGAASSLLIASHMFLALFTVAPSNSLAALVIGVCWTIVFGALAGALVALAYNAFGLLQPRPKAPLRQP